MDIGFKINCIQLYDLLVAFSCFFSILSYEVIVIVLLYANLNV